MRTKAAHDDTSHNRSRTKIEHFAQQGTAAMKHAHFSCRKGNTMKQPNDVFNDFQARMSELFKNSPAKDVERNLKAMLSQGFSKLDLVTREEFDTQTQVLVRTRARLEELERRVAELEQKLPVTQTP
ncbi:BMFP domain-containing protein YqiC [Paraburkholderia terricola]|nr:BMFP domain-containing protein YqiC [Paraburkholderia terricola]